MMRILGVGVLVLIIAAGAAWVYLDRIAVAAIEKGGEYALGVETTLDSFRLRPLAGSLHLAGLAVDNPEGFETDHFLTLGSGEVVVDLGSLRGDPIIVQRVELSDVSVSIERAGRSTNYDAILANLERLGSAEAGPPAAGPAVVIEELVIRDVNAKLRLSALGGTLSEFDVNVPEIRLTDLGREQNGMELAQVIAAVTQSILKAVAQSSVHFSSDLAGDLNRRLRGLGGPAVEIPGLARETRQLQEKLGATGERAEKILEGVGNLLGGGDREE